MEYESEIETNRSIPNLSLGRFCQYLFQQAWKPCGYAAILIVVLKTSRYLSIRYSSTYRRISPSLRSQWDTRVMDLFNAALAVYGANKMLHSEPLRRDLIYGYTEEAETFHLLQGGYMVLDLFLMIRSAAMEIRERNLKLGRGVGSVTLRQLLGQIALLGIHHVGAIALYFLVPYLRKGLFIGACFMMAEVSNPFLYLRWFFQLIAAYSSNKTAALVLGVPLKSLLVLNHNLLTLVFFCCRIVLVPSIFLFYARSKGISIFQVPMVLKWHCTLGTTIVWLMNLFWWTKLVTRPPAASKDVYRL